MMKVSLYRYSPLLMFIGHVNGIANIQIHISLGVTMYNLLLCSVFLHTVAEKTILVHIVSIEDFKYRQQYSQGAEEYLTLHSHMFLAGRCLKEIE